MAWEGITGRIIINGLATANYAEDLGILFLNEWTHETADALYSSSKRTGPIKLDYRLINGTNVYGDAGARFSFDFVSGTSYCMRLVNGAIDTTFSFMIDNHTMTIIAADFVSMVPYTTDVLSFGIGQRYDILVNSSEATVDFWMHAIPQAGCTTNEDADDIKGIVRYDVSSTSDPTTTAYCYSDSCEDEPMVSLVPYLELDVDEITVEDDLTDTARKNIDSLLRWYISSTTFVVGYN